MFAPELANQMFTAALWLSLIWLFTIGACARFIEVVSFEEDNIRTEENVIYLSHARENREARPKASRQLGGRAG